MWRRGKAVRAVRGGRRTSATCGFWQWMTTPTCLLYTSCMVFGVELLLALAVGTLSSIYELYFSMALGQMSRNHKIIWSVLWFVAVSTVFNFISMVLMGNASLFVRFLDGMENGVAFLHVLGLGLLAMKAVRLSLIHI